MNIPPHYYISVAPAASFYQKHLDFSILFCRLYLTSDMFMYSVCIAHTNIDVSYNLH